MNSSLPLKNLPQNQKIIFLIIAFIFIFYCAYLNTLWHKISDEKQRLTQSTQSLLAEREKTRSLTVEKYQLQQSRPFFKKITPQETLNILSAPHKQIPLLKIKGFVPAGKHCQLSITGDYFDLIHYLEIILKKINVDINALTLSAPLNSEEFTMTLAIHISEEEQKTTKNTTTPLQHAPSAKLHMIAYFSYAGKAWALIDNLHTLQLVTTGDLLQQDQVEHIDADHITFINPEKQRYLIPLAPSHRQEIKHEK